MEEELLLAFPALNLAIRECESTGRVGKVGGVGAELELLDHLLLLTGRGEGC